MKHKDDWKAQWEAMEDAGEAPDIADFVADVQKDAIENPPTHPYVAKTLANESPTMNPWR